MENINNITSANAILSIAETVQQLSIGDWLVCFIGLCLLAVKATDGKLHHIPNPEFDKWFSCPQVEQLGKPVAQRRTRNINAKMTEANKDLVVFWGTQSGTAKVLAKSLAREASARFNIKSMSADLDDYDHIHLADFPATKVAVFIIATYGEGDPPDNTQDFCSVLDQFRCSPQKALENMSYAAFGLGNRNYAQFNKVVDVVDESFQALGAKRLGIVGKGDESTGSTEIEFSMWKNTLFKVLPQLLGTTENPTLLYVPDVQVTDNKNARPTMVYRGEPNKNHLIGHFHVPVTRYNPHIAPVTSSRHLFDASTRHCIHMEFNIAGFPSQQMAYETGDHLAIWPSNPSLEVERMLTVIGAQSKDDVIDIVSAEGEGPPVPSPSTRDTILRYYLEICASPTKDTVSLLAHFAPSKAAAEALMGLTSSPEKFKACVTERYLTLASVLQSVDSSPSAWSRIPFSFFIEHLPRLRPRYYSISSSSAISPQTVSITAIVTRHDVNDTPFQGVASNYILSVHNQDPSYDLLGPRKALAGKKVYLHLNKSKFRLPQRLETDVIMICAGTGIAPFRAFIMERTQSEKTIGKMKLFYGCRNEGEYLYRDELLALQDKMQGKLEIVPAYSRAGEKVYVQGKVREQADEMARMILNGANVYICGSAAMAREVEAELVECLRRDKGAEAEKFVKETMKKTRRLQEDVW